MKVLFYISKIYSIPVIEPLQNYLRETDGEFAFFVSNKVLRNFPAEWEDKPVYQQIEDAISFNPDLVIASANEDAISAAKRVKELMFKRKIFS